MAQTLYAFLMYTVSLYEHIQNYYRLQKDSKSSPEPINPTTWEMWSGTI